MGMNWKDFNADCVEPETDFEIKRLSLKILVSNNIDESNKKEIKEFAQQQLENYHNGQNPEFNKTIGISIFRPNEFSHITENDESIKELLSFLSTAEYDWQIGSKSIQRTVNGHYESAGDRILRGGREKVILDSLIRLKDRNVAIEYETSINFDNGYFSLRQAIKSKVADYGVMIVPWHEEGSGRANEAKATGHLDRDCDSMNTPVGPIYRISIVRLLDIYKDLLKV